MNGKNEVKYCSGEMLNSKLNAQGGGGFAEASRSVITIDWSIIFRRFYEKFRGQNNPLPYCYYSIGMFMKECYHPIFLSCSISKSIAKSKNNEPMMNMRSESAARMTNISVSFMK